MPDRAPSPTWAYCPVDELVSPPVRACHAYWASKVTDGRILARADIDPVEFRHFLPHCLILDVEGPDLYRYRLFGTHVAEGNGRDLTGLRLDADALGDAAPMFLTAYRKLCDERAPVAFKGSLFWQDRGYKSFEQVSVPLSGNGSDVNKIFCAVAFGALHRA
jgi:hypothetical protein